MTATASPLRTAGRRTTNADSPRRLAGAREYWILGAIVLLGVLVRFPTVGEQSFWYDEAVTHGIVAHGLQHVFSTVPRTESTPPLYYVLVWLWSRVFGTQEAGLRSFSALCGTLTIPVVWLAARRLISERVAWIAALLTAVNPLLFWYSQEARSYALLVLLSALSLVVLGWALERPTEKRLAVFGLTGALALATHYFAIFLLVPEATWLILNLRRRRLASPGRLTAALGPIVLIAAVLTPLAIHQNNGRASFIANQSGSLPTRLAQLVKQDVLAFDEPAKVALSAIALLLVAVGVWALLRRTERGERSAALDVGAVGVAAILLAVLVGAIGTDYVDTRNLLPSWPALGLAVATGFAVRSKATRAALAALVGISLACVVAVIVTPTFQRPDWRGAAQAMGPPLVPRAIVGDHEAGIAMAPHLAAFSYYPANATVREVDLFALIYRNAGAHESLSPPRPRTPPVLPGFTLVTRKQTSSYTVFRYRAPAPVTVNRATLIALTLVPHSQQTALLQEPR